MVWIVPGQIEIHIGGRLGVLAADDDAVGVQRQQHTGPRLKVGMRTRGIGGQAARLAPDPQQLTFHDAELAQGGGRRDALLSAGVS